MKIDNIFSSVPTSYQLNVNLFTIIIQKSNGNYNV